MSLKVTRLELRDFRSYEKFVLEPDPRITVLVGPNGVGKTNVIEGLQILASTTSFRKPNWGEVVRWGSSAAHLSLKAEGDERVLDIKLDVAASGRREFRVNGKVKRRLSEVMGEVPTVVFTPEDLRMVKESADRRRAALDSLGIQLSPAYGQLASEYDRVVRHRNALLKQEELSSHEVGVWDEALVRTGASFRAVRRRLFERLKPALEEAHRLVAGGGLEAAYVEAHERDGVALGLGGEEVTDPEEAAMVAHLREKRAEERARKVTLAGPHRDDVSFTLGGKDARKFSSQGQQRALALAWKLAEVEVVRLVTGKPPLLLLDDVMSELDEQKRHALAGVVGKVTQTVITTTDTAHFEKALLSRATVVRIG